VSCQTYEQIKISKINTTSNIKKVSEKAMILNIKGSREVNTTMDFSTANKHPVTPLHKEEKTLSCGSVGRQHDLAHSCLSPPPPPLGRRSDDAERTVSSMNISSSNDLLVFPSLTPFNLQAGKTSSGHIPTFKLQPKRGGLSPLHEEYFK
jgi:hypothetical protein